NVGIFKYKWNIVKGNLNLEDTSIVPLGTNQRELYILPHGTDDSEYTFGVEVTDAKNSNISARAEITIPLIRAPRGGKLTITPSTAQSITGEFVLVTGGWTADPESLPLRYQFYRVVDGVDIPISTLPRLSAVQVVKAPPTTE